MIHPKIFTCVICRNSLGEHQTHYAIKRFAMLCGMCVSHGKCLAPDISLAFPQDDTRAVEVLKNVMAIYRSRAEANEMRQRLYDLAASLVVNRVEVRWVEAQ